MTCCYFLAECFWSTASWWYRLRCTSVSIPVNHKPHQRNASSGYQLPDPRYAQLLLYHPGWLNVPSLALCTVSMMYLTSRLFPLAIFWHCKTFREHIWVLQTPVFNLCVFAFSPVCPEGQIQYSKKAHQSAVQLSVSEPWNCLVNLCCMKGILQSWKAALLFVAACSDCVDLLVNLK